MRVFASLLRFSFAAVLLAIGLVFLNQNLQEVSVEFAYWSSREIPLALALFLAFGAGVFLAGLYFLLDMLRMRAQVRKSRRLAELLERELDALRNAPLYDELPSSPAERTLPFDRHLTHEGQPEASVDSVETKRFR